MPESTVRQYAAGIGEFSRKVPVAASTTIYESAAVSAASATPGTLRLATAAASEVFHGFAEEEVDNSQGAAGDVEALVRRRGLVLLKVATVADSDDVGKDVYASDSETFTLAAGTNNLKIGKVEKHHSGDNCWVYFEAAPIQSV